MNPARYRWSTRTMMKVIAVIAFALAVPRIYQSIRPYPYIEIGMPVFGTRDHYWYDIAPYLGSVLVSAHILLLSIKNPPPLVIKLLVAIDYCVYVTYAMGRRFLLIGPGSAAWFPDHYLTVLSTRSVCAYLEHIRPQGASWYQLIILIVFLVASLRWRLPRTLGVTVAIGIVGWQFYDWLSPMRSGRFFGEDGMPAWIAMRGWEKAPVYRSDLYEAIRLALLAGYLIAILIHCREKSEETARESQMPRPSLKPSSP